MLDTAQVVDKSTPLSRLPISVPGLFQPVLLLPSHRKICEDLNISKTLHIEPIANEPFRPTIHDITRLAPFAVDVTRDSKPSSSTQAITIDLYDHEGQTCLKRLGKPLLQANCKLHDVDFRCSDSLRTVQRLSNDTC